MIHGQNYVNSFGIEIHNTMTFDALTMMVDVDGGDGRCQIISQKAVQH